MIDIAKISSYSSFVDALIKAEQNEGWLCQCAEQGMYLAINDEMLAALADFLYGLNGHVIVEICAGRGELTAGLTAHGLNVIATDANPMLNSGVIHLPASKALEQFKPDIVLGCFVPFDAGINEEVMTAENVKHYIVINANIGGQSGISVFRDDPRFEINTIPEVAQWLICRHDIWLGLGQKVLTHGEAWHIQRK